MALPEKEKVTEGACQAEVRAMHDESGHKSQRKTGGKYDP